MARLRPISFGFGTGSEGWAYLTDSTCSPVQSQRDSVHMLYADERERLPLGTPEAVTVLVIGESVLVIWVFEEPLACLRDHHLLTTTVALR